MLVGCGAEIPLLIQSKQSSRRDSWGFRDAGHSLPLVKFELMVGFRHTMPMSLSPEFSVHFVRIWTHREDGEAKGRLDANQRSEQPLRVGNDLKKVEECEKTDLIC